jgi:hypothetical protein
VTITAEFEKVFDVTVGTLEHGTIVPDVTKAAEGETVTLTVDPDDGYMLKEGTLKYNGEAISGTSFEMPAEDVVITAEFETV